MGRLAVAGAALLLGLTFGQGTPAPAAEGEGMEGTPLSLEALGLRGKLIYKNFSHFTETDHEGNFRNEGTLELEWHRKFGTLATADLVVQGRNDDGGFVKGFHERFPDTEPNRSALGVKELVLGFNLAPVRLALGKQTYSWGTGDGYNPTDNISPYDYLDPLDREKIGVWSANATTTFAGTQMQFVIVPLFTPARDPLPKGRWVAVSDERPTANSDPFGTALPAGATLRPRQVPATDWDTIQYAARLKTTRGGWDLSVSYYDGFESTPVLRRQGDASSDLTVEPVYTRIKVPGVDVSTTWRKFEFHGEAVAKFVEHRGKDDRFQGLAGFNYTWDDLGVKWIEQVVLVLEYARETNLSSRRHSEFLESGAFTNAFRDALIGRAQVKFSEETQFTVGGTMDVVRDPNYYLQLKLTHKLRDSLHVEAGLDFIDGLKDTFWGKWRKNDRFFMSIKYFF